MELVEGKFYPVSVISISDRFVSLRREDNSTEKMHFSRVAREFVTDPRDYVSVGDKFVAICIPGKTVPVELSFEHLRLRKKLKTAHA